MNEMRIGILDIDTKKETDGFGRKSKYPNIACGKIYGYHKLNGDEVIYPYNGEKVDRLYISTIFTATRPMIKRMLPYWEQRADEILIGGTGWDDYTKAPYTITGLPPEIEAIPHMNWTYEMYDINYGIGFTTRGCHVGCSFCVVPKKEGMTEYRDVTVKDLINPRGKHVILMNNNSLAHKDFYEDIEEIKEYGLTVHWDQANDITLVTPKVAQALRSVDYRGFDGKKKQLFFAFDLMTKKKIDPETGGTVTYDMTKVVPERVKLLNEFGIPSHHLVFYMLIGFNTTEEEDLERVEILRSLGCEIYPMLYRDLNGKVGVDWRGNPQPFHVRALRDWINSGVYRKTPFKDFDRRDRHKKQRQIEEMQIAMF
ncbi:hypothetical protein SD70_29585 [Gordoniibacillus kamchatkensis]|uniref:Radical SAM core domain-containing protein n=2 Tax=Gordoniibacillus kamchatkensis TaxID=1590651 RepID=A0ABR5AA92_9BACL|nr:hypothetical protein SD70_29585 [Paenibacillus sp. VKM B-2647]